MIYINNAGQAPIPKSWETAVREFHIFLMASGRTVETQRLRILWIRRFARAVKTPPWEVTENEILSWSGRQTWKTETRRSAHQSVKAFYAWAETMGYVSTVPRIPMVKRSSPAPHPASENAIEIALSTSSPALQVAIRLGAELGLRRGEIARINSGDVIGDLMGESLIVHGKGNKVRVVPIPAELAQVIKDVQGFLFPGKIDGHISPAWLGTLISRALPPGVTAHALRHRFTTVAYAKTNDLVSVQKLLGHASPATTLHYLAVADEALRRVVDAVAVA